MKKLIVFVATLATSVAALAESTATSVSMKSSDIYVQGSNENPAGWVPFAAVGVSAVEFDKNLTGKDGVAANARIIGSYYAHNLPLVFDAGLGFDSADLDQQIESGLFELAGRYRFTSSRKWHVGPVANLNFGGNVGTSYGSSAEDLASFAGAQLIRDFAISERGILRAGLKAMTDIGIPNSTVNKFLFEIQLGQVGKQTVVSENHTEAPAEVVEEVAVVEPLPVVEEEVAQVEEVVEEVQTEIVQEVKAVEEEVVTTKSDQSLYFHSGSDKIGPANRAYVSKLADLLKKHKDQIKSVKLIGYADPSGSESANRDLSVARAKQISRELKAAGLEDIQVEELGAGELTAAEVASDLRRARRVDVEISGTANNELEAGLKAIRRY